MTRLSHRQYSVDLGAYPLGSCTMKYNPKVCDEAAALPGLTGAHPATPAPYAQGWLALLWGLSDALCRITGMHAATLQPPAGAAGRADRAAHHEGVAPGPGTLAGQGAHPGLGPRHQPGVGQPGRLPDREPALRQPRAWSARRPCASTWTTTWPASCSPTPTPWACSRRTSPNWPPPSTTPGAWSITTAPTSTPSSASPGPATWASTSCTSTCTRPSPCPTAAAVPGPARWP